MNFFFLIRLTLRIEGDWAVSSVGRMRLSYNGVAQAIKMRSWVRAPGGPRLFDFYMITLVVLNCNVEGETNKHKKLRVIENTIHSNC